MKKSQVAVLALLALAAAITVGCGSSSNPTFKQMPMWSNRTNPNNTPMFIMNLDGSDVTSIPTNTDDVWGLSISANTKTVSYTSEGEVWVGGSNGSNAVQLTHVTDNNAAWAEVSKLSPNGKKIVYAVWPEGADVANLSIMNADGSGSTSVAFPDGMTSCFVGSFSPDSSKITFACANTGYSSYGLYTMKVDGTQLTMVVTQSAEIDTPMFTPNGKQILYVSQGAPGISNLRRAAVNQNQPTHHSGRLGPHNSTAHHYGAAPAPNTGVAIVNLDGSTPTLLVPQNQIYESEVFNSNLYYMIWDSNLSLFQIYKANIDGTGSSSLSDGTTDDELGACGDC